ncbi:pseudouridine synthase [Fistulina hepatica ATCC 64428]|uniref:Pseudouridine synthase n=1 Tax=Fistulina hepatica ATCC 64428 TaxID=1128425 RepID=A0A0D7AI87_9AGAR|nr:pseudouridine synthase [Fistulina hepatica ATCC 64428]
MAPSTKVDIPPAQIVKGLKKIPPYWHPYITMAKERWLGRELLEVVTSEFRDRSTDFYRYALESGVTTINGKRASPETIIRNGDRIENVVHRHEPPVTATPVKIILNDKEREFIVIDKPGSIPVHAAGRYYRNSLAEMLKHEFGYEKVYTVNRLDRLTSGLLIIPTSPERARTLSSEFMAGTVKKEYIARCSGEFPAGEVVCEQPLLTVDRQVGLNIVHPEGKHAKTIFQRIRYDANSDTSVVLCKPITGRSHQIRVHLQYLGHPIANDQVYCLSKIWGPKLGKGGLDTTPNNERQAPTPPEHVKDFTIANGSPETRLLNENGERTQKLMPRETGDDIGLGSPVALSSEAMAIIRGLRNLKDEDQNWGRWRDVVFRAKGLLLQPENSSRPNVPPSSDEAQVSVEEALRESAEIDEHTASMLDPEDARVLIVDGNRYCSQCYLPLHPDPKPEQLYIFLHALRYSTSLGVFETEMPEWAAQDFTWDQSIL